MKMKIYRRISTLNPRVLDNPFLFARSSNNIISLFGAVVGASETTMMSILEGIILVFESCDVPLNRVV